MRDETSVGGIDSGGPEGQGRGGTEGAIDNESGAGVVEGGGPEGHRGGGIGEAMIDEAGAEGVEGGGSGGLGVEEWKGLSATGSALGALGLMDQRDKGVDEQERLCYRREKYRDNNVGGDLANSRKFT